jgi:hypothetical protein
MQRAAKNIELCFNNLKQAPPGLELASFLHVTYRGERTIGLRWRKVLTSLSTTYCPRLRSLACKVCMTRAFLLLFLFRLSQVRLLGSLHTQRFVYKCFESMRVVDVLEQH